MRIKFYAHACFRIEGSGVSLITDPYTPSVAQFDPVGETADIVLMSSGNDRFHSDYTQIPGDPHIINALDVGSAGLTVDGLRIQSFPNRENKSEDAADNAMYGIYLDGMTLLHMGDAGHLPTPEQIRFLADQVDILLALVGGPPTITLGDLDTFIAAIRPRLVIPMHYYNPRGVLNILPVTAYTDLFPPEQVTWLDSSELEITPESLPEMMQIVVLQQSR
ncbi:MAG: MBL fold metallo-hydrolase [Anaerolineae bacterium]